MTRNDSALGKVAVITGGTSGIGRACAVALGRTGVRTILIGRQRECGESVAESIRREGAESEYMPVDILISSEVSEFFSYVKSKYGSIDYAVNAAGTVKRRPLVEHTEADWDLVLNTNLRSMWLCLKHEIPLMLRDGGSIVNVSSIAGIVANDWGISAYIASKHGVIGLTRAAALEYASAGIRVNAVCPGVVRTEMTEGMLSGSGLEKYRKMHPLGEIGEPEEVADAVLWLCSDRSQHVTGISLPIDGGITAG